MRRELRLGFPFKGDIMDFSAIYDSAVKSADAALQQGIANGLSQLGTSVTNSIKGAFNPPTATSASPGAPMSAPPSPNQPAPSINWSRLGLTIAVVAVVGYVAYRATR